MTCVTYDESTFDPSGDGSYAADGGVMDGGFDAGMDIPEGDMTDGDCGYAGGRGHRDRRSLWRAEYDP